MVKTCSKCKTEKELCDFPKDKSRYDGHSSHCKECRYDLIKKWRANNPEKVKNIRGKYYLSEKGKENNKNKCKEFRRTESFKDSVKKWRTNNKEREAIAQSKRSKKYLKNQIDHLGDIYVRNKLKKQGFPLSHISSDLIEIKRIIIKTKRVIQNHENKNQHTSGCDSGIE